MNPSSFRPALLFMLASILIWHAILFYGLPLRIIVILWVCLSLWLYFAGPLPALLAAGSIALFTLLLNIFIGISGLERSIYYRPHELLRMINPELGESSRPNTQLTMEVPFGDIEAREKAGVRELPHKITYNTDSLGFRNPKNYYSGQSVLAGDSFVEGVNDTQSCIVSEWLRLEHGINMYNLGYPGDMDDYVRRIEAFRRINGNDFKLTLFVFEGNDFRHFKNKTTEPIPSWLVHYFDFFRNSNLWRYTRWLYLRVTKKKDNEQRKPLVKKIGGSDMSFLSTEPGIATNRTPLDEASFRFATAIEALKPNLVKVFFIPVKYRVYAQWITTEPLPNLQWEYLSQTARQAGIPAFDLTPALTAEAARLLPQGQYVYWRDDTHWNCNGMRVAATQVARVLESH